jgi:hypothetical protein
MPVMPGICGRSAKLAQSRQRRFLGGERRDARPSAVVADGYDDVTFVIWQDDERWHGVEDNMVRRLHARVSALRREILPALTSQRRRQEVPCRPEAPKTLARQAAELMPLPRSQAGHSTHTDTDRQVSSGLDCAIALAHNI